MKLDLQPCCDSQVEELLSKVPGFTGSYLPTANSKRNGVSRIMIGQVLAEALYKAMSSLCFTYGGVNECVAAFLLGQEIVVH